MDTIWTPVHWHLSWVMMAQPPTHTRATTFHATIFRLQRFFYSGRRKQTQWHPSNLNFGRRSSTGQIKCDQITQLNGYVLGNWNEFDLHFNGFDFCTVVPFIFTTVRDDTQPHLCPESAPFHFIDAHVMPGDHVCDMLVNQRKHRRKRSRRNFFIVTSFRASISDASRDGAFPLRNLTTRHLRRVLTDVNWNSQVTNYFCCSRYSLIWRCLPSRVRCTGGKKRNNEPTKTLTITRATVTNKSAALVLLVLRHRKKLAADWNARTVWRHRENTMESTFEPNLSQRSVRVLLKRGEK